MGETELAGGELAWEKGARVALHDQRPPRLGGFTLRVRPLGPPPTVEAERELRRLEEAMAGGDHAETLRRYGEAQARLEHARLRLARPRHLRCAGSASPTRDLDRGLETFSAVS